MRYPQVCGFLDSECFVCHETTKKRVCVLLACCQGLVHRLCFKKYYSDKRIYFWKFPKNANDRMWFRLLRWRKDETEPKANESSDDKGDDKGDDEGDDKETEETRYLKNQNKYEDFPECICGKELYDEFEYVYNGQNWIVTKFDTGESRVLSSDISYTLDRIRDLFRDPTIKSDKFTFKNNYRYWSVISSNGEEKILDYDRKYTLSDIENKLAPPSVSNEVHWESNIGRNLIKRVEITMSDNPWEIPMTKTVYDEQWQRVWDELTKPE